MTMTTTETPSTTKTKMTITIASYRNHILHSSVYIGIIAFFVHSLLENTRKVQQQHQPTTTIQSDDESSIRVWSWLLNATGLWKNIVVASTWTDVIGIFIATLAGFSLYHEVMYVMKRLHLPPGDSGWPLVGHLPIIIRDPTRFYLDTERRYGTPFTFNLLMTPIVSFRKDEDVSWFLAQERKRDERMVLRPHLLNHIRKLLGEDTIILQPSGWHHRRLRRLLEPAFSPAAVRNYADLIDATVRAELKKWSSRSTDNEDNHDGDDDDDDGFMPPQAWAMLAMKLFFACAVGGDIPDEKLARLNRLFHVWSNGTTTLIPFAYPGGTLARGMRAKRELERAMSDLVTEFKRDNPPGSEGAHRSFLGRLCYEGLRSNNGGISPSGGKNDGDENKDHGHNNDGHGDNNFPPLSEEQLIVTLVGILFAGHDTTKGSFGSFLHYLKQNPRAHQLLIEEASTIFPLEKTDDGNESAGVLADPSASSSSSSSSCLDYDQLKNGAPVLNAFLAEAWRLMAPFPSHNLQTTAEGGVTYKQYRLPKGTAIRLNLHPDHLANVERYPNPTEFRLERWIPPGHPLYDEAFYARGVDYNTMSVKYRTFHAGTHMCLGAHFAKLEGRILLMRLVQSYDIEIRNTHEVKIPLRHWSNEFKLIPRRGNHHGDFHDGTVGTAAAADTNINDANKEKEQQGEQTL